MLPIPMRLPAEKLVSPGQTLQIKESVNGTGTLGGQNPFQMLFLLLQQSLARRKGWA